MKRKLKVCYLCSWSIGAYGKGGVSFVHEQISALAGEVEAYYAVLEFVSVFRWLVLRLRGRDIKIIDDLWSCERVKAYKIYRPKWSTKLTKRSFLQDINSTGKGFTKRLLGKIGKIDLVHCHVVLPYGLLGLAFKKFFNIPYLIQEHSAPFEMHLDTSQKKEFVDLIFEKANHIIAVGPFLKERIIKLNQNIGYKATVIPEMIRTDVFDLSPNKFSNVIRLISVGGLVKRKGYDYLINAIKILKDENYNVRLTIVGEGDDRTRIEKLISSLELTNEVCLTGHLDKTRINILLEEANLYVQASLRETFGIAPTEAMLKGRPVVSTKCEGPEFYINKHNGILVESRSAEELVRGIKYIISNFELFNPTEIRKTVEEKFGEKTFLKKMFNVYVKVLDEK